MAPARAADVNPASTALQREGAGKIMKILSNALGNGHRKSRAVHGAGGQKV
jgi:hypothetical protein